MVFQCGGGLFSGGLFSIKISTDLRRDVREFFDAISWFVRPSVPWCFSVETPCSEVFTLRIFFYTEEFLHTEAFTQRSDYTESLYTQTRLHTEAFTQRSLYTEELLHTRAFTHRSCYTQTLLHKEVFTQRTLTHRRVYRQKLLRKEVFTERVFTHGSFHTQKFLH